MADATPNLSVRLLQKSQHRERLAGTVGLVVCAVAFGVALVLLTGPLPLAIGLAALVCVVSIAFRPRVGLYLLLFCAIFLEQWAIAGLDPLTARLPFYQTLSGSSDFPL